MYSFITSLLYKATLLPRGRWLTHTPTQSDLEGPAIQLNPVLIQTSTPCAPLSLRCSLFVLQHKANPGLSLSGNEIRYNAPNVFRCVQQANKWTLQTDFQLSSLEELGFQRGFQKFFYLLFQHFQSSWHIYFCRCN